MSELEAGRTKIHFVGGKLDGKETIRKLPLPPKYHEAGHDYTRDQTLDRGDVAGYRWVPLNPGVRPG